MIERPTKLALVSKSDFGGGAALAVRRLHKAILRYGKDLGLDSVLFVRESQDPLPNTVIIKPNWVGLRTTKFLETASRYYCKHVVGEGESHRTLSLIPTSLPQQLREIHPDYVNFHWLGEGTISLGQISALKYPTLFTFHDYWLWEGSRHYPTASGQAPSTTSYATVFERTLREAKYRISHNASRFVFPSRAALLRGLQIYPEFSGKSRVIPNPIGEEFGEKPSEVRQSEVPINQNNQILFVAFGDIQSPRKGLAKLEAAIERAHMTTGRKFSLRIVGQSLSQSRDWGELIGLGQLSPEQVREQMSKSDVVAISSADETFCQTAVEARWLNKRIVAFDIPAISEILSDYPSATLIPHGDIIGLAAALNGVQSHSQAQPKSSIQNRYSGSVIVEQLWNLILEIRKSY